MLPGSTLGTVSTLSAPERLRYKCFSRWTSAQMEMLGRPTLTPLEVLLSEPADLALLIGHVLGALPPMISGSRVATLASLLDYLRRAGVPISSDCTPEDLAEKELVTVMKLAWRLAWYSLVKTLEPILRITQKDSERHTQKVMMDWVAKRIGFYPNVNTRSMSSDFADGLLFCALLHKQNSRSIKWNVLDKNKRETNLETAFRLYHELYKIPRMLDVEDMLSCEKTDKRALWVYLGTIISTFAQLEPGSARGSRRDMSPPQVISPRSPGGRRPVSPPSQSPPQATAPLSASLTDPFSASPLSTSPPLPEPTKPPPTTTQPLPESLRFTQDQLNSVFNALSLLQHDPAPRAPQSDKGLEKSLSGSAAPPVVNRAQSEPTVDQTPAIIAAPPQVLLPPREERRKSSCNSLESLFQPLTPSATPSITPSVSVSPPANGAPSMLASLAAAAQQPRENSPVIARVGSGGPVSPSSSSSSSSNATNTPHVGSGPLNAPPPTPFLSSSLETPSMLSDNPPRTPGRPKSIIQPPTELQRQMIDFSRAVASLVKELKLAAPGADCLFDATRFARALTETVKSCRALVMLLPADPPRRRLLSEAMMSLSQAGSHFVEAAGLPDNNENRAYLVEQTSRDFGQAIHSLAAQVRVACQAAGARAPIDETYLRETEDRVRTYLKSFSETCRKVLSLAAVRPVSSIDHVGLVEALDSLIRLGKSHPGQNAAHIDSLLANARVAGFAFSAIARRGESDTEALSRTETEFTTALENAIQATKASLSAEVQGARRTLTSSSSSGSTSNTSTPVGTPPTATQAAIRASMPGGVSSEKYFPPNLPIVSPRTRPMLRASAPDGPYLAHSMSRQRLLSEASTTLFVIAKEINTKPPALADTYRAYRSAVYVANRLLQDLEKDVRNKDETEAVLDFTMNISTAAQELITVLKGAPDVQDGRVRQLVGRFVTCLRLMAERFIVEKEDRCSICDTKLTEKESEAADRTKSSVMCGKCSAPLGSMQTTFDDLLRSVQ